MVYSPLNVDKYQYKCTLNCQRKGSIYILYIFLTKCLLLKLTSSYHWYLLNFEYLFHIPELLQNLWLEFAAKGYRISFRIIKNTTTLIDYILSVDSVLRMCSLLLAFSLYIKCIYFSNINSFWYFLKFRLMFFFNLWHLPMSTQTLKFTKRTIMKPF